MYAFKIQHNNKASRVMLEELTVKDLRSKLAPVAKSTVKITFYDQNNVSKEIKTDSDLVAARRQGYSTVLTISEPRLGAKAPTSDRLNPEELRGELLRAVSAFYDRTHKPLRHVETREVTHTVVDVKNAEARPLGKVVPSRRPEQSQEKWQQRYFANIAQLLWERIQNGPSATEDPQIRKRIAQGNFKLRHVEPRVKKSPVVGVTELCLQLESFKKSNLRKVNTKESTFKFSSKDNLIDAQKKRQSKCGSAVFTALKAEIVSSSAKKQLNHVHTRVSHLRAVRAQNLAEVQRKIHTAVVKFNKNNLKSVQTTETHKPVRPLITDVERQIRREITKFDMKTKLRHVQTRFSTFPIVDAPKPAAAAPSVPASTSNASEKLSQSSVALFQANLARLEEIGFGDRKQCIAALIRSKNVLEEAVLLLVGA